MYESSFLCCHIYIDFLFYQHLFLKPYCHLCHTLLLQHSHYNFHTLSTFIRVINEVNKNLKEKFDNPTLIIWGELDQLVPKKSIEEIYKHIDNEKKKIVVYKDISHLMLGSKHANKIVREILDFIKD